MRIPSCVPILSTLAVFAAGACSDSTSPDNSGSVRIIVEVAGLDPDPDGFQVSVDGGTPIAITPPDTAIVQLDMGHHSLTVSGLSPNCDLNGPATRSIAVNSAETADVLVFVNCTALTGVVEVRTETTGLDLDPTGYGVSLDTGPPEAVPVNGVIRFPDVPGGSHQLDISGLEGNCSTGGAGPVDVTVQVGGFVRDTARVVIGVSCTALTGVIEVRTVTTGPDQAGFEVILDAGPIKNILANGFYRFDSVPGGVHSLSFSGFVPNCTAAGLNPRQVNVSIGGLVRDTVRITVDVACTATTGVVKLQTSTTGFDQDPDGYLVSLDGGAGHALPVNGFAHLAGVSGGAHELGLGGFAPNCSVAGPNPVQVSISVGGTVQDTVDVVVNVSCTPTTGAIRVSEATTGPYHDPSYLVSVDGSPALALPAASFLLFGSLTPGSHSVTLSDIASTCTVTGSNPAAVTVAAGDTAEVVFDVACTEPPRTGVNLVVTTTGPNQPSSYFVYRCEVGDYCYYPTWWAEVAANSTTLLEIPAGSYYYYVQGVPQNCTGSTAGLVVVAQDAVTQVSLSYTCLALGTLLVDVPATGIDIDPQYYVTVDGSFQSWINAGDTLAIDLLPGPRVISLQDVASNCLVGETNPKTVTVVASDTIQLTFPVTCQANPTLQVTVVTTGPLPPSGTTYLVGIDSDYYYDYVYEARIPVNGGVSISLPPGGHYVTLDEVPANCTVTSANNVTVTMTLGVTTNLAFTVLCH